MKSTKAKSGPKKARPAPAKKRPRRARDPSPPSASGSARRKGHGDTAIAAFRKKLAKLPRAAYQELEATSKSLNANLEQEAEALLAKGWHHQGLHLASLAPPVDWKSDNRSFSFCLHAWTPLLVLLVLVSRDHKTALGRRCLQASVDFASDWLRNFQAPVLNKGVSHLFTKAAGGRYGLAWYDMAVGQRINRLAFVLDAAGRDPRFSDELIAQLLESMHFHHRLLARDDFFRLHSNHGLYQALGQLAAAKRFGAIDSALNEYAARSEQRLDALLEEQFSPSGMHKEHSPGYHYITGSSLSGALENGLLEDRPAWIARLSRIEEALSWMIKPDLSLPSIGDTDPVRLPRSASMAARYTAEPMRWVLTRGETGTPPPLGVASFQDAGYAFARLAPPGKESRFGDAAFLAQIAGFHSRVHKHADHLSFVWHDKGRDIFIDPGRYAYAGRTDADSDLFKQGFWYSDPKRIYCESTRAHNTVEIDGKSFPRMRVKPFGSALLQADEQNGLAVTFCAATHFRRVRHQRQIIMGPGRFLLVLDWLYDRTGEPHDYRQFFHFDQKWNVRRNGDSILAEHPGHPGGKGHHAETMALRGATLIDGCQLSDVVRGQSEPELLGWLSDRPNRIVPTDCFHVHARSDGPTSLVTLFVFGDHLAIDKKKTRFNATMSAGVVAWEDTLGKCEIKIGRSEGKVSAQFTFKPRPGYVTLRLQPPLPGPLPRTALATRAIALTSEASSKKSPGASKTTVRPRIPPKPREDLLQHLQSKSLRVAAIMDDFTAQSFGPECTLQQLTPAGVEAELQEGQPHILFVESAWRGKDELWGSKVGHRADELLRAVAWCNSHGVPTVFWNKEDPVHFASFLSTAQIFDYVFTTDIDCIARYKAALGHERVYLLPFACQPEIHNPIDISRRKTAICFAGAYYERYPERSRDFDNLVEAIGKLMPVHIYDRNHGKPLPGNKFPERFAPMIVGGLPAGQINKAYKSYDFALNLNSIKQSQSMFARRVYELLACNTITLSNFSRGLRLLFGDLVPATDNGEEAVQRLNALLKDKVRQRKFRLAGLRKVMAEHTYQDRLAYVLSKVQGTAPPNLFPEILVVARVDTGEDLDSVREAFDRQHHRYKKLVIIAPDLVEKELSAGAWPFAIKSESRAAAEKLTDTAGTCSWVAYFHPQDYYGPHYLLDLALATRYCHCSGIGKAAHYKSSLRGKPKLKSPSKRYKLVRDLPIRAAITSIDVLEGQPLLTWAREAKHTALKDIPLLAVDEFSYCADGGCMATSGGVSDIVDDLTDVDQGLDAARIMQQAENISPLAIEDSAPPYIAPKELAQWFPPSPNKPYSLEFDGESLHAFSSLEDKKTGYLYSTICFAPSELDFKTVGRLHLKTSPGLRLSFVVLFLDRENNRLGHVILDANRNHEFAIPDETCKLRLGLRFYANGKAQIIALYLNHLDTAPSLLLGAHRYLLITNNYPSYDNIYRNGFVHSRVKGYARSGVKVDVFRLCQDSLLTHDEYEGVDVHTGPATALTTLMSSNQYEALLVHFMEPKMWTAIEPICRKIRTIVWVHGAEIQPLHRREYNYTSDLKLREAQQASEKRTAFWKSLLIHPPPNLHLVFVSSYFAKEVMEDLRLTLPPSAYSVIHNPIDTSLFSYTPKHRSQRLRILSIRPYSSRKYANDLSVQAVLLLSRSPLFKRLHFRFAGDGPMFDEILEPLRAFDNVQLERGFLNHVAIAKLHKEYGLFLTPTRMDSQGVSRDEAMASGLVPVTTRVAAVREFVDAQSGILAEPEDAAGLSKGITRIAKDPDLFLTLSRNAAERVKGQSSAAVIIRQELDLITGTNALSPT